MPAHPVLRYIEAIYKLTCVSGEGDLHNVEYNNFWRISRNKGDG